MTTLTAALPRVPTRERVRTGGQWFKARIWDSCLDYVRRSNAYPHPTDGRILWQQREAHHSPLS